MAEGFNNAGGTRRVRHHTPKPLPAPADELPCSFPSDGSGALQESRDAGALA